MGVTLHPEEDLQHACHRRTALLKAAAACSNVHLYLNFSMPLDVPAIWRSIRQLTLCDVPLDTDTISSLRLAHLTQLHTITFSAGEEPFWHHTQVDVAALQKVIQAGGLCALRCLRFERLWAGDTCGLMLKLAPMLGRQITSLTFEKSRALIYLPSWPVVMRVCLPQVLYHTYPDTSKAAEALFSSQQLKEVVVPGQIFAHAKELHADMPCTLHTLKLTGRVSPAVLSKLPLHGVQHLQLHSSFAAADKIRLVRDWYVQKELWKRMVTPAAIAAMSENLGRCGKWDILPGVWNCHTPEYGSILGSTPTIECSFDPELLKYVLSACDGFCGAVALVAQSYYTPFWDEGGWNANVDGEVFQQQLEALQHLPSGVHTLCIVRCRPVNGTVSWFDIPLYVPQHVTCLVIMAWMLCIESVQRMLQHPPPEGLKKLHLLRLHDKTVDRCYANHYKRPWKPEKVAAMVSEKWPGVELLLGTVLPNRNWDHMTGVPYGQRESHDPPQGNVYHVFLE